MGPVFTAVSYNEASTIFLKSNRGIKYIRVDELLRRVNSLGIVAIDSNEIQQLYV